LDYAKILDIPCIFSSNGDGFLFHDRTAKDGTLKRKFTVWFTNRNNKRVWQQGKLFASD
jgi:type I site-specific restriction endonuclease